MTARILVDDNFKFMDEDERYQHGVFDTVDEALGECRGIVDADLAAMAKPGLSPQALYNLYVSFGRDPFIICDGADDKAAAWSAWKYSKARCNDMLLMVEAPSIAPAP
jgi:hypothetical protein